MTDAAAWSIALIAAYLLGSVPFGLLLGFTKGVDIRQHGSGNIGATNLLRTCGTRIGILGFGLDLAKGSLPVLATGIAFDLFTNPDASAATHALWLAVGTASMVGHLFPVYLKFKGGKGVATGLGMLLAFYPWTTFPAVAAFATWVIVLKLSRYVSVASIAAAIALPIYTLAQQLLGFPHDGALDTAWVYPAGTTLLAAAVVAKHKSNIARLRAGTESPIRSSDPKTTPPDPGTPSGNLPDA